MEINWAEQYLRDIVVYREAALDPFTDPNDFGIQDIAQRPGMEWLNHVIIELVSPSSKDLNIQRMELADFYDRLYSTSSFISHEEYPGVLPKGVESRVIAVDTETTGLDVRWKYGYDGYLDPKCRIVGLPLAISDSVSFYLPVFHTESDGVLNWNPQIIAELMDNIHQNFIALYHNAAYDREVLALNGVTGMRPYPYFFDTMILDFMKNVNDKRHGLKLLSETLLQRKMIEIHELFIGLGELISKRGTAPIYFWKLPAKTALVYAASDSMNTFALFDYYRNMEGEFNCFKGQYISSGIDHRTSDALRSMLRPGLPVQYSFFYYAALDTEIRINSLRRAIMAYIGHEFYLDSPKEVSKVLFEEKRVPVLEGMEKNLLGVYSTAKEVLKAIQIEYPDYLILNWVILYRSLQSTLSKIFLKCIMNSYTDAAFPWTRVKLDYSITNVPTGRLSSSSKKGREKVTAKFNKKSTAWTYDRGDWSCGFNSQGIPSDDYYTAEAKKISKFPEGVSFEKTYPGFNSEQRYTEGIREVVLKKMVIGKK